MRSGVVRGRGEDHAVPCRHCEEVGFSSDGKALENFEQSRLIIRLKPFKRMLGVERKRCKGQE